MIRIRKILSGLLAIILGAGGLSGQTMQQSAMAEGNNKNQPEPPPMHLCYRTAWPQPTQPAASTEEEILKQIKQLEKLYQDKKIDSITYQRRRKTLEDQIKEAK